MRFTTLRTTSLLAAVSCLFSAVSATIINGNKAADLCSSLNTDSNEVGNYSMFQTQGLCTSFCRNKNAAYAIVQYYYCWCSSITPGEDTIVNDSRCDTHCPGYSEWCGSQSADLFGYVKLGPSATATIDSTTSSTSTSTSSTSSTSSSTSSTTTSQQKTTSVQTTTDSAGAVATVTTIATIVPQSTTPKKSNTALIASVTVGISAVVILAIAGFFWYKWRKHSDAMEIESKVGWGGATAGAGTDGGFLMPSRGDTRFMPTDPRMDPFTPVYSRKSHESIGTLRDEQDYSRRVHQPRVLRAVNPDPLDD